MRRTFSQQAWPPGRELLRARSWRRRRNNDLAAKNVLIEAKSRRVRLAITETILTGRAFLHPPRVTRCLTWGGRSLRSVANRESAAPQSAAIISGWARAMVYLRCFRVRFEGGWFRQSQATWKHRRGSRINSVCDNQTSFLLTHLLSMHSWSNRSVRGVPFSNGISCGGKPRMLSTLHLRNLGFLFIGRLEKQHHVFKAQACCHSQAQKLMCGVERTRQTKLRVQLNPYPSCQPPT